MQRETAGGVIVNGEGKIALVEQHGNSWAFPKGGVEAGETTFVAAKREIFEETGITELELKEELGSYVRRSIGLDGTGENMDLPESKRTLFLFTTAQTDFSPHDPDGEITGGRWVTIDEALALLTHPKDGEFLRSVRKKVEEAVQ